MTLRMVGRKCGTPAPIPATGSALDSLSSVALSSVRIPEVYLKAGCFSLLGTHFSLDRGGALTDDSSDGWAEVRHPRANPGYRIGARLALQRCPILRPDTRSVSKSRLFFTSRGAFLA